MRIILLLIVIAAILAVVQSKRHNCTFGEEGWLDCVIGKTADEFSAPEAPSATSTAEVNGLPVGA